MVDLGFIPARETRIRFSLEPAYNALCSLILLNDDIQGCDPWVAETAARLTAEQRAANDRLADMASLHLGGREWTSFPAWVDDLAARDPYRLCEQELDHLIAHMPEWTETDRPDRAQLLTDHDTFMAFVDRLCRAKDEECDPMWSEDTFRSLQDPPARQAQLTDHLRLMWDTYLAEEWERKLPMLQDSVRAFESLPLSNISTTEAVRRIIRRDEPDEWRNWREDLDEIIFIPSPHIGPYLLLIDQTPTTARVVFGARIPEGATVRSAALSRSDLFMRLSALADEMRLRILEVIALEGELGAKDIMDRLELSKSAASRHLRELTAHGYLIMRQQDVSKYYRLNPDRIDDTWQALRTFLRIS